MILKGGPNWIPAVFPAGGETGERYIASTLFPTELPHKTFPGPISSFER